MKQVVLQFHMLMLFSFLSFSHAHSLFLTHSFCIAASYILCAIAAEEEEQQEEEEQRGDGSGDSDENLAKVAANVSIETFFWFYANF